MKNTKHTINQCDNYLGAIEILLKTDKEVLAGNEFSDQLVNQVKSLKEIKNDA